MNPASFQLRDLPLAAKLVLTTFLLAVGLGYFSAMVQLHLQHGSRDGQPLPTVDDVIERFSGLKRYDGKPPISRLELIISGPKDGGFDKNNMTRAFFDKASGYDKEIKERGQAVVDAERDTERQLVIAWGNLDPVQRKKAYDENSFAIPAKFAGQPVTEDSVDEAKKLFKIKEVLEVRCAVCHNEGDKSPALDNWANIESLAAVPELKIIDGQWVKSSKQTSIEGLTQSTHAHALSFAMLFSLTGLVFAFTSYPSWFRCILAPIVLIAQVADIACWWLARLDGVGPYFAQAILGTGSVVGMGLSFQILLSLFNMYSWKGKWFPFLLVVGLSAGLGVVMKSAVLPALEEEKKRATQPADAPKPIEGKPVAAPAQVEEPKPPESDKPEPEPKKIKKADPTIPEAKDE